MNQFDYDLVVIGAGSAGLVAAVHARGLHKNVLLIDSSRSLSSSKYIHDVPLHALAYYTEQIRSLESLEFAGIKQQGKINSAKLLEAIHAKVKKVSAFTSFAHIKELGIETAIGRPQFESSNTILLAGNKISSEKFIIATGSSPHLPKIEGIESEGVLTTESFLKLNRFPQSVVVVGGGAAGVQFASLLLNLGIKVALLEENETILVREDWEISSIIERRLRSEGLGLFLKSTINSISASEKRATIQFQCDGKNKRISAEKILIACGRTPNVSDLGLEKAGVQFSENGIDVARNMSTSAKHIYACGDVTGPWYYTNKAEKQGAVAAANACGGANIKINYDEMIWSLALHPDLAHLGVTESEAIARFGSKSISVYKFPYKYSPHSVIRDSQEGYAKIICRNNGKIIGAHIIGENAVEIAHELQLAKEANINFAKISFIQHIFPSYSDVLAKPSLRAYVEQSSRNFGMHLLRVLFPHTRSR